MVSKFYLAHGLPQCLGAVYGNHVNIKKPKANANDYTNGKGHYSFNVQAAAGYQYCFFDVVISGLGAYTTKEFFLIPS